MYTEFQTDPYRHMQNTTSNSVTPVSKVRLSVRRFFTKLKLAWQLSKKST